MKKTRSLYKKPKNRNAAILATVRIVLTALTVAVLGMVGFYAATQGWQAVFAWFGGPYACMCVIIGLFAATAALWLWKVVKAWRARNEE